MARQTGPALWSLNRPSERPNLTADIVAEKGKMVVNRYGNIIIDLTAAAIELANERDPVGLQLLSKAAEMALGTGVEACAANLGVGKDEN